MDYQSVFERVESKYTITRRQYDELMKMISCHLAPDLYPHSNISSLYFDTDDYRLIRDSLDKGSYREKLRLRSYCLSDDTSEVFFELKKKYHGVTHKRRQAVSYRDAMNYILFGKMPCDTQIMKEIDYLMSKYQTLKPRVLITYQRDSYAGINDTSLRVTFDYKIQYSLKNVSLRNNIPENNLSDDNTIIMEIKSLNAMPLWMTAALDELKIYPSNYSKYGLIYTNEVLKGVKSCLNSFSHQYTMKQSHLRYLSSAHLHQSY